MNMNFNKERDGDSECVLMRSLLIIALLLCLSGCASSERTQEMPGTVQQTLQLLAKKHRICGVAVAVIKNRRLDRIDTATGCVPALTVHADSVFQAASLSKPVFAYAVLKLVAQGKLELDAPIVKYLPQGYRHQHNPLHVAPNDLVTDPRLQAITVRMALNHTSGLPGWAFGALSFESTPGTTFSYSGEGYMLLQRAVEAVTAQPLDRFMASHIFQPLAMTRSGYVLTEPSAQHLLPGTKANGKPRSTLDWTTPVAAASLFTTASDYGKFLVAMLNDEALIKQISALPAEVDPSLGLYWGLGWGIEDRRDDAYFWHWGNNPGYRAFTIASVRGGNGFVMLTNSENGLELAQPLAQKILPGEHQLFRSSLLGVDVLNLLCNSIRLCI